MPAAASVQLKCTVRVLALRENGIVNDLYSGLPGAREQRAHPSERMRAVARTVVARADAAIMTAAVCDYRPAERLRITLSARSEHPGTAAFRIESGAEIACSGVLAWELFEPADSGGRQLQSKEQTE